jgi:AcrR family transcriptional regulator
MLLATAEVVAERGYQKTTIELIAKTARVALVTFYEHFADKEECFLAAFDETVAAAGEAFDDLLDPEQPWPDQIASGLEVFLEMVEGEPARAGLCIVASQAAGTVALARFQAMLESVAPKLREGRELNPRASRLPDGLEIALAGGLVWLVHQRLVTGRLDGLKALLPEMLQLTLTPYTGEVEAGRAAEAAQARVAA